MRKAIVYATLSGTVLKCAEIIAEKLGDMELINIKKDKVNVDDYDMLIIGGAYYAGALNGKLKKFIKANEEKLKTKPYAIFICCGSEDDYKEILIKNVGNNVVDNAVVVECFGSELNIEGNKGFIKLMNKMIAKAYKSDNKPMPTLHDSRIEAFCNFFRCP